MNCNRPQPRLAKSRGFFYFYDKEEMMYFTITPEGNRMEALMKKPPGFVQRGGGRRRPYRFTK